MKIEIILNHPSKYIIKIIKNAEDEEKQRERRKRI